MGMDARAMQSFQVMRSERQGQTLQIVNVTIHQLGKVSMALKKVVHYRKELANRSKYFLASFSDTVVPFDRSC